MFEAKNVTGSSSAENPPAVPRRGFENLSIGLTFVLPELYNAAPASQTVLVLLAAVCLSTTFAFLSPSFEHRLPLPRQEAPNTAAANCKHLVVVVVVDPELFLYRGLANTPGRSGGQTLAGKQLSKHRRVLTRAHEIEMVFRGLHLPRNSAQGFYKFLVLHFVFSYDHWL